MRCSKVKKLLEAYIDAELPEKVAQAVEKHIEGCPECREEEARVRSLNTLINEAPVMPVPFGFSARVMDRLREEQEVRRPVFEPVPVRLFPIPAFVRVAAAVIMVFVIFLGVHLGVSFPAWNGENGMFQAAEFGDMPSDSVENEYFDIIAALCSNNRGGLS